MAGDAKVVGGVARLLRQRRKEKGLSQPQLSDLAGVSIRQITRWENAQHTIPQKHNRDKLGAVLDITERDFWEAAGEFAVEEGARRVADEDADDPYADLPDDQRQAIGLVEHLARIQGRTSMERVWRQKARRSPASYGRWCRQVIDAWGQNLNLALFSAEDVYDMEETEEDEPEPESDEERDSGGGEAAGGAV